MDTFVDEDDCSLDVSRNNTIPHYSEIPFDVAKTASIDIQVFGFLGKGKRIGTWGRYLGGVINILDGSTIISPEAIGLIVGDVHGRIVMAFDEGVYYGWLENADYEPVIVMEVGPWTH